MIVLEIMLQVKISAADLDRLKDIHANHPDHVSRRRALVMILKNKELPHHQIADIAGVCENTLREYFASYQAAGIDSLMTTNFYKPESKLKPFDDVIKITSTRTQ